MTRRGNETRFSTEGPTCPHCGLVITPDENVYYDELRYTEETCPDENCGKTFRVQVFTETSWTCSPVDEDEAASP